MISTWLAQLQTAMIVETAAWRLSPMLIATSFALALLTGLLVGFAIRNAPESDTSFRQIAARTRNGRRFDGERFALLVIALLEPVADPWLLVLGMAVIVPWSVAEMCFRAPIGLLSTSLTVIGNAVMLLAGVALVELVQRKRGA